MFDFVFDLLTCKRRRQAFPPTEDLYQIKRRKPNIVIPPSPLDRPAQVACGKMWVARGKTEPRPGLADLKDPEELYKRLISSEDEQNAETLRVKIRRLSEVVKLGEENLRRFKRDKETETISRTFVAIEESDFVLPVYALSPEEVLEVEDLWEHQDDAFEVRKMDNIPLSIKDVKTLRGRAWLNDEVINCYGYLLSLLNPNVLIHNTYFLTLLSQRTSENRINLPKIDRIHKRKNVDSLFSREKVLIPVNINGSHWACYCIDHKKKAIIYYDSFSFAQFNRTISEYVEEELKRAHSDVASYDEEVAECPQQENGVDCGVFMLMNMRNCVAETPIDFSQAVIPSIRKMIAHELKQGKLRG